MSGAKSNDTNDPTFDVNDLPGSPDTLISPSAPAGAGMSMRSGRKKRRRSKETSGLTPEAATAKKQRRWEEKQKRESLSEESTAAASPAKKRKTRTLASPEASKEGDGNDDDDVDDDQEDPEEEDNMEDDDEEASEEEGSEEEDDEQKSNDEDDQEEEEEVEEQKMPAKAVGFAAEKEPVKVTAGPDHVTVAPVAAAADVDTEPTPFTDTRNPIPAAAALPPRELRMPSAQTPGKATNRPVDTADTPYDNRYRGHVAAEEVEEPPSVTRVTQEAGALQALIAENNNAADTDNGEKVDTPVRRLFRSIQSTIQEIIVPHAEGLDLDDDDLSQQSSPTSVIARTSFWIILLLVIQLACFQIWINPILTGMTHLSESSVLFYKDLLGVEPLTIETPVTIEVKVPVEVEAAPIKKKRKKKKVVATVTPPPPVGDEKLIEHNIQELAAAKERFLAETGAADAVTAQVEHQIKEAKTALLEKRTSLKAWDAALSEAEEELHDLLATPGDIPNTATVEGALDKVQAATKVKVNPGLVVGDSTHADNNKTDQPHHHANEIPMWEVVSSSTGCPQPPSSNKDDPLVSKEDVQEGAAMLKQRAQETVRDTTLDPEIHETVTEWVKSELEARDIGVVLDDKSDNGDVDNDEEEEDDDMGLLIGVTEDEAKQMIGNRLEGDLADMVGLLDVASLYNGAEVIRSGSTRATTPSLVQSLPLLNRFLAATKLRFYGHGPEAALSPTIPPDGLGQCWSFENVAKSKNPRWRTVYKRDKANGMHASLTIRLAKPTTVKRVIIDHVGGDSRASSAIRDFRVIGYTDQKAQGTPAHLGAYQYRQDGDGASQQFAIMEEHDQLQSITLAIDSTYSEEYACLYRFRVLEN